MPFQEENVFPRRPAKLDLAKLPALTEEKEVDMNPAPNYSLQTQTGTFYTITKDDVIEKWVPPVVKFRPSKKFTHMKASTWNVNYMRVPKKRENFRYLKDWQYKKVPKLLYRKAAKDEKFQKIMQDLKTSFEKNTFYVDWKTEYEKQKPNYIKQ